MNKRPQPEHIDALVRAVQLPADVSERKAVLVTLLALLPRNYDRRALVALQVTHLRCAELSQLRLALPRAQKGAA